MSIYNKTKEEICVFLEKYQLSDKTRQFILNEFIDGEVLLTFNDKYLNIYYIYLIFINNYKIYSKIIISLI